MIVWIKRNILRQIIVKCIILKKQGDSYKVSKVTHQNTNNSDFDINNKKYVIDISKAVLDKNNNLILFYLDNNTFPICFGKAQDKKCNAKLLKCLVVERAVRSILGNNTDIFLVVTIIGLIIGIVAVSIFSFMQLQNLQETIIELSKKIPVPPIIINS